MEYNVFKTLRVIVKVLSLICIFLLLCNVQLHIQENNLRSGTVCDKQIVEHIFTEKEYVIYISDQSRARIWQGWLIQEQPQDFQSVPKFTANIRSEMSLILPQKYGNNSPVGNEGGYIYGIY